MYEYAVSIGEGTLAGYGVCDEVKADELVTNMGYINEGPISHVENGCFVYDGEIGNTDAPLYGLNLSKPLGFLKYIDAKLYIRAASDDCVTGQ